MMLALIVIVTMLLLGVFFMAIGEGWSLAVGVVLIFSAMMTFATVAMKTDAPRRQECAAKGGALTREGNCVRAIPLDADKKGQP